MYLTQISRYTSYYLEALQQEMTEIPEDMLYQSIDLKQPRREEQMGQHQTHKENSALDPTFAAETGFQKVQSWLEYVSNHGLVMRGLKSLCFPLTF